jgi:flagellar hook-associated protein 1 FlgK
MPGLNAGLYVGLSGIQAQQAALNVVGNNIANVNTPGYSRQQADLTANQALASGGVYFGTGVTLSDVQGIRSQFLDLQLYHQTALQSGAQDRYAALNAISPTLADSGTTGLSAQIQTFFQGFQNLAARPEDTALRTNVIGQAQNMISSMQSQYQLLSDQQGTADQSIQNLVTQVNTLTSQIAQLNTVVTTETSPGSRNDARDQRAALTTQLAKLVGIHVTEGSQGDYQITLDSGSAVLVSGNTQYQMIASNTSSTTGYHIVQVDQGGTLVPPSPSSTSIPIQNGSLGAQLDLRDNVYAGYKTQLDTLAAGIASQVNLQHQKGYALDGTTTGLNFFTGSLATGLPPGATALNNYQGAVMNLAVDTQILQNPSLIAAAGAANAAGDNANANALGNLQFSGGTNASGLVLGSPFSTMVGSFVSKVGTDTQSWNVQSTTQQNLVTALQAQRDSVSGVDLNEEAASLMTLQQGYQASTRFLSVINQLMQQLVTSFGQ